MSFDPSANQFNSLHYLGWMGIFIKFPHTCLLWHKGNESFLCHNNMCLDSLHQEPKVWLLLCWKNSEHSTQNQVFTQGHTQRDLILVVIWFLERKKLDFLRLLVLLPQVWFCSGREEFAAKPNLIFGSQFYSLVWNYHLTQGRPVINAADSLAAAAVSTALCWKSTQTYHLWEIKAGGVIQAQREGERGENTVTHGHPERQVRNGLCVPRPSSERVERSSAQEVMSCPN